MSPSYAPGLAYFKRPRYPVSVEPGPRFAGVAAALVGGAGDVLSEWLDRYVRSPLRLPGAVDRDALGAQCEPLVAALAVALAADDVRPGAPSLREVEKGLSFLGAHLSASGCSGFDAAALVCALRDTLLDRLGHNDPSDGERDALFHLFDWFSAVALDAFAQGCRAEVTERFHEQLVDRTPVVLVAPDVPAAFPIGDARVNGLRGVFARLALTIARVGARVVIVDASGLSSQDDPEILAALSEYASHRKIAGRVALVACGLSDRGVSAWRRVTGAAGMAFEVRQRFWEALGAALERSDFAYSRRRGP
ncbi:MAG: hypothetical protein D6689_06020 [Deltaproteobacteria bacterium]|nr:MAG: hypothetical protein D6689_06020 [Deltaproteobacteria bacterium]